MHRKIPVAGTDMGLREVTCWGPEDARQVTSTLHQCVLGPLLREEGEVHMCIPPS